MRATLPYLQPSDFPAIRRGTLDTLQVNLGYVCNQQCQHCHVNAGPNRTETMDAATADAVIAFLDSHPLTTLDLTGGAPELNAEFRRLVRAARARGVHVIDRCNLTVLLEPGEADLAEFLAEHQVEVIASLPCYEQANVDGQRGRGVYERSVTALQRLNALGYGSGDARWTLNLVYNPVGPVLPPPQCELQQDYQRELRRRHGIVFDNLYTLTNMPIQRFGSILLSNGEFDAYMALLRGAYRPENLHGVMCRHLVSVDWRGYVYDCDFNQMLGLPLHLDARPRLHLSQLDLTRLEGAEITVADHCYGCTAGQGSSCGGALV